MMPLVAATEIKMHQRLWQRLGGLALRSLRKLIYLVVVSLALA